MWTRRRVLVAGAALGTAALLPASRSFAATDQLRVALSHEPPHLDPTVGNDPATLAVSYQNIFEGLTRIDEKGQVFLMDQPVEMGQLVEQLKTAAKQGFDERIYVRGSKAVNYGRVAEVMSLVTTAGYKKVALVTEQEKK